jgi:hypothetical protein
MSVRGWTESRPSARIQSEVRKMAAQAKPGIAAISSPSVETIVLPTDTCQRELSQVSGSTAARWSLNGQQIFFESLL